MNNAAWASSTGMLQNQTQLSSAPGVREPPSAEAGSILWDVSWATSPCPRNGSPEGSRLVSDPLSQSAFFSLFQIFSTMAGDISEWDELLCGAHSPKTILSTSCPIPPDMRQEYF